MTAELDPDVHNPASLKDFEALRKLGIMRVAFLAGSYLRGVKSEEELREHTAKLMNFSVTAIALDELIDGSAESLGPYKPASWIYTSQSLIEVSTRVSPDANALMRRTIFFSKDATELRGLNRMVSSKIPAGTYEPTEFAQAVLDHSIAYE